MGSRANGFQSVSHNFFLSVTVQTCHGNFFFMSMFFNVLQIFPAHFLGGTVPIFQPISLPFPHTLPCEAKRSEAKRSEAERGGAKWGEAKRCGGGHCHATAPTATYTTPPTATTTTTPPENRPCESRLRTYLVPLQTLILK